MMHGPVYMRYIMVVNQKEGFSKKRPYMKPPLVMRKDRGRKKSQYNGTKTGNMHTLWLRAFRKSVVINLKFNIVADV